MSLDLSRVARQIEQMAGSLKDGEQEREKRTCAALETLRLQEPAFGALKQKISQSKTSWPVAELLEEVAGRHQPPACPADFTVIATDGSHIDVDRHTPPGCYLINVGSVTLSYGPNPRAALSTQATLYASEEDLTLSDPSGNTEQQMEGALLAIKRAVAECQALAALSETTPQSPLLALLDGSLILWGLEAYPEFVKNEMLDEGMIKALDSIKSVADQRTLALASYISLPRSAQVINALKVAVCPHETADCDRHCSRGQSKAVRACDALAGVQDRDLFDRFLQRGDRSSSFASSSMVVKQSYGDHSVLFFYVKTEDDEIARVEYPIWVEQKGLTGMVHALVLDQCRRGQGYPVALSEAHEQAVITVSDREQFQYLIQSALADKQIAAVTSAKSKSKRTRWV